MSLKDTAYLQLTYTVATSYCLRSESESAVFWLSFVHRMRIVPGKSTAGRQNTGYIGSTYSVIAAIVSSRPNRGPWKDETTSRSMPEMSRSMRRREQNTHVPAQSWRGFHRPGVVAAYDRIAYIINIVL